MLYNGVLSGVALKGDAYFTRTPEATATHAVELAFVPVLPADVPQDHGRIARIHLCAKSGWRFRESVHRQPCQPDGEWQSVELRQPPPSVGRGVQITMESAPRGKFALNLRLPARCDAPQIKVNGRVLSNVEKFTAMPVSNANGGKVIAWNLLCPCRCNASTHIRRWRLIWAGWRSSVGRLFIASRGG